MRLTPEQQHTITSAVQQAFGHDARVLLFGSRVDDSASGGDVDLLIETPTKIPLADELSLAARLEMLLDMPVDIITHSPQQTPRPIMEIARLTGAPL